MDFQRVNACARLLLHPGNESLLPELIAECLPYLYSLRARFRYFRIPQDEVRLDLATDAVSDAMMRMREHNLPFCMCLQNAFRDRCRKRLKILREQSINDVLSGNLAVLVKPSSQADSPEAQIQKDEIFEKAREILDHHEPFSQKVVYQRMDGLTYTELIELFSKPLNECKRVYGHDLYHMRKEMERYREDWQEIS